MEDEATKRWAAVLPRLTKHYGDYHEAWNRLSKRRDQLGPKWVIVSPAGDEDIKRQEMYRWCSFFFPGDAPSPSDKFAAEKFARLEVRVTVCEETALPATQAKK